jgi:hypothetical protein
MKTSRVNPSKYKRKDKGDAHKYMFMIEYSYSFFFILFYQLSIVISELSRLFKKKEEENKNQILSLSLFIVLL